MCEAQYPTQRVRPPAAAITSTCLEAALSSSAWTRTFHAGGWSRDARIHLLLGELRLGVSPLGASCAMGH